MHGLHVIHLLRLRQGSPWKTQSGKQSDGYRTHHNLLIKGWATVSIVRLPTEVIYLTFGP
jgi:hypothetical protein